MNEFNLGDFVLFTDNKDVFAGDDWRRNLDTYYTDIYTYFMLSCNRFKWKSKDLNPENNYSQLIEYYLNRKGQCFIDKSNGNVLQGTISGSIDMFGNPTEFNCFGYNGTNDNKKTYKYNEVIWIKNNYLRIPTLFWIYKYCKRINEVEKAMDLNLQAQKTPYIIEGDPLIVASIKAMFEQIDHLKKCVITDKEKSIVDNIKILKLDSPYLIDKLYDQKINEENNLLQVIGIDTINEKNAHMLYAEVQNSNEITDNYSDMFLSERRLAIDQAEKAGIDLQLSVLEVNTDMEDLNGEEEIYNEEQYSGNTEKIVNT